MQYTMLSINTSVWNKWLKSLNLDLNNLNDDFLIHIFNNKTRNTFGKATVQVILPDTVIVENNLDCYCTTDFDMLVPLKVFVKWLLECKTDELVLTQDKEKPDAVFVKYYQTIKSLEYAETYDIKTNMVSDVYKKHKF